MDTSNTDSTTVIASNSIYAHLKNAFNMQGDSFDKRHCTIPEDKLKSALLDHRTVFFAWGEQYVYFLVTVNDQVFIDFMPRNPCGLDPWSTGG